MATKVSPLALSVDLKNWKTEKWRGFDAWRRLGDVISSVLFLGYHQLTSPSTDIPAFLVDLRKLIFVRIYSDDKNVAVFLGRPPRLTRMFCHFQLPRKFLHPATEDGQIPDEALESDSGILALYENISFSSEICWAALCACLKEKALEAHQNVNAGPERDSTIA